MKQKIPWRHLEKLNLPASNNWCKLRSSRVFVYFEEGLVPKMQTLCFRKNADFLFKKMRTVFKWWLLANGFHSIKMISKLTTIDSTHLSDEPWTIITEFSGTVSASLNHKCNFSDFHDRQILTEGIFTFWK